MLRIDIPSIEEYDEEKNEFYLIKPQSLHLEHSLISISKWESFYCKPFLSREPKTVEETVYYIKCMTINSNVDPRIYRYITNDIVDQVNEYIEAPMSATTFTEDTTKSRNSEVLTSELLYYYMIAGGVPVEFEKWHLNRLITLLRIIGIKNDPNKKKMSKGSIMRRNASLNAARRKAMHSKG